MRGEGRHVVEEVPPVQAASLRQWLRRQPRGIRRGIAAVLVASLLLNTIGISWGLPNGNRSWAADALQPLTPLAVGRHVWFGDGWNSGWFYFKYPVGHPLLLLLVQSPVLAAMWAWGELERPRSQYPFGFKNPERSLAILAGVSRAVSAAMGTATVFLGFCTLAILANPMAGLWGAVALAGTYPFVFYSHTSNVDVPLLFWLALCAFAAVWSAQRNSVRSSMVAGVAAAMALLTKEQGLGFLAAVPIVWLLAVVGAGKVQAEAVRRHVTWAGLGFVATTVLVANIPWNPSGYINRWQFLAGTLPPEVRQKYAPYQFPIRVPSELSLSGERKKIERVAATLAHASFPVAGVGGILGFVALAFARPRTAVSLFVAAATYYAMSLRALELVQVRYTLPMLYMLCLAAGGLALALPRGRLGVLGFLLWALACLAPGTETVRLLLRDPRYVAERWFGTHLPVAGVRAEVYQPFTYLPRFPAGWTVQRVPVEQRTIESFAHRRPDLVVISSGGKAGLVGRYRRERRPNESFFSEFVPAREFFRALERGDLGYSLAAHFSQWTWLAPRIHSLNPQIWVYTPREAP